MFIQLKQVFETIGSVEEFESYIQSSDFDALKDLNIVTPIFVKMNVQNKQGEVVLNMSLSFSQNCCCDRCLENLNISHDFNCKHILVSNKNIQNNDENCICLDNFKLDLNDLVITNILLNLPSKNLCDENCLGLCYQCGTNLNTSKCECQKNNIDPRLESLSQLLK